jgi:hypothetical protein
MHRCEHRFGLYPNVAIPNHCLEWYAVRRTRDARAVEQRLVGVVRNWGSTPEERDRQFPCDALVTPPYVALFRALVVEAPVSVVFRWLCQLRVAPYSYDWIDNLGRRSPRTLTPRLDELEVGQRFMIFRLAHFEPDCSITLTADHVVFGRIAITYRVTPRGAETSRLVVKLLVASRPGPFGWLMSRALPAGDLVMMRRQLLNLKKLAEQKETP